MKGTEKPKKSMERVQTGAYRGHERARRGTIRQSATIVRKKKIEKKDHKKGAYEAGGSRKWYK